MTRDQLGEMAMSSILLVTERDAYRRIALALVKLIHEGQGSGLQDIGVNRMRSNFDVQALVRLESELETLERGEG